jgi:hypothetical protein
LLDPDRKNAIDSVLQDLGMVGGLVAGRQFTKQPLYEFLLHLPRTVLFEPSQSKHEHFKDCLRKAIMYLGIKGGQYHVTEWVDNDKIEVLMKAINDWRPDNTFVMQQLNNHINGNIISTID